MTPNEIKTSKFVSKAVVQVRCGGRGAEMLGKTLTVKTKGGSSHAVRLTKLIKDWGAGDCCEFEIEYL